MTGLVVEAEDDQTELLGKTAGELQENIIVRDASIEGTLKYVTGYTGYSGDPTLQSGNFLALKFEEPEGATGTTIELIGGIAGPVALDEDMNAVIRITNPEHQQFKVSTTVDGEERERIFGLANLHLEPAPVNG